MRKANRVYVRARVGGARAAAWHPLQSHTSAPFAPHEALSQHEVNFVSTSTTVNREGYGRRVLWCWGQCAWLSGRPHAQPTRLLPRASLQAIINGTSRLLDYTILSIVWWLSTCF